ncbi:MAG: SDR family NAD(P)-dependent oxidoreductase [Lachnospiraceae bacterium]|nr:SDR family NAD(P)-dependent oxidoreductase [Lachnospiraceae bacterium]MDE7205281.1 SDR family NAD(P)-dependent oxidoreductase [Lachnospiraceae bacterium]
MSVIDKKKALVTGASRGIGKAVASTLASLGYDLYMTCHKNSGLLNRLAEELQEKYQIKCKCYAFPICDEEKVAKMFQDIPYLDILVNNAGISYIGLLTDMTYKEWQEVIDTNLNACFLTCRAAVPEMVRRRRGKIINISSVWGNIGASTEVAYSASKGGVNAFTRALAKELGPSNIQVNAIACGVIDTGMNRCFDEEEMNMLIQEIPSDRMGRPDEVAELVKLLCTGNEYLTGQVITLDGGWT